MPGKGQGCKNGHHWFHRIYQITQGPNKGKWFYKCNCGKTEIK